MNINPNALFFVALFVLIGLAAGHWLVGAIIGVGLVVGVGMWNEWEDTRTKRKFTKRGQ